MPLELVPVEEVTSPEAIPVRREYTEDDREAAYFLWRTTGGQNVALVSRLTGVPYGTLDSWKRTEGWKARAAQDNTEMMGNMGYVVNIAITSQMLPNIITAQMIRDNPAYDPKARLEAAKWLAGLAGYVPASRSELEVRAKRAAVEAKKYEDMSHEELLEAIRKLGADGDDPGVGTSDP